MKANEAPEKIYLDEDESWHLTNPNGDSVEYIRTDAFIKRIHELLSCRIDYITYYHDKTEFINEIIEDISEDIE